MFELMSIFIQLQQLSLLAQILRSMNLIFFRSEADDESIADLGKNMMSITESIFLKALPGKKCPTPTFS